MTPTDCPTPAALADFHAGRLPDDGLVAIAEHLDRCPRCLGTPIATEAVASRPAAATRFDGEAGCRRARQRVAGIATAGPGVGSVLGDFRLLRELGRGGMGVVYEAEQRSLGRRVAVKLLNARGSADAGLMRRFDREARAVGRLHHTNIVPVFGVGEHDGAPYYAMQLIRGVGLEAVIDALARARRGEPGRGGLADRLAESVTPRVAAGLIAQAADGVGHAHDQGVLHRDVKPSNLLLDEHGTVWVTDFGLAKTDDAADLTEAGDLLGTVRYLAPEAFDGTADHRADVYALGLTLYELLALRPAFGGSDRARVMRAVLDARPTPLGTLAPGLPRDLLTVVARATDRDPARRYQSAHALADDLRRFVRDEPILARRVGPAERLGRWAKRNRGLAAALAVLAVTLVGVAVGSLVAAGQFRAIAASESEQRRLAEAAEAAARSNLYAAEMGLAARVAEQPTGLARLRELVGHWGSPAGGRPDPRGWEWRVFRDLARPERWVRTGRQYYSVAYSPDGTRLAVGVDQSVELLDPAGGTALAHFPLAGGAAWFLVWSADGRRLAVGQDAGGLAVLDAVTGRPTYQAKHGGAPPVVCFHPGGHWLASHGDDGTVRVHDLLAGTVIATLPGATPGPPTRFEFRPDGRRLATQTGPLTVSLWDTADWTPRGTANPKSGSAVSSLSWLDGRRLVMATADAGVLVWDAETDAPERHLSADRHLMVGHDVSAGGKRVAAGDWGRLVWVWDAETGRRVTVCRGHTEAIFRVALAPDGARVAAVGRSWASSALRAWDVPGRQPVRTFDPPTPGRTDRVGGLAWHPDGDRLAATTHTSRSVVHDLTGKAAAPRRGFQYTWDRAGRRAVSQDKNEVLVFDAGRDTPTRTLAIPGQFKSFDWNPIDGRLAVRACYNLWVGDPARPDAPKLLIDEPRMSGPNAYHPCGGVAWHPAGRTLAFPRPEAGAWWVHLIDPTTGVTESKFDAMPLDVWAVKWSPDGSRLAVAGDDPAVRVFDPATGAVVQELRGHTFTVRDVAYSPDGTRLATAGLDGTVILWDAATGRLILTFELGSPVLGVAWSRDGAKLAALPETGVVKVWDAGGLE